MGAGVWKRCKKAKKGEKEWITEEYSTRNKVWKAGTRGHGKKVTIFNLWLIPYCFVGHSCNLITM